MNRNWTLTDRKTLASTLIAACALLASGCSSDGSTAAPLDAGSGGAPSSTGGHAGSAAGGKTGGAGGGATGGAGGTAAGGGGGTSGGGTGGGGGDDAGAAGAGGAGGTDGGDAGVTPLTGTLLVAAADFKTNVGEIATVDLATGHLIGRVEVADGDLALTVSGGRAFAMERSGGAIDALSATGTIDRHIVLGLGDGGAAYLNPHDVLVADGSKAYVPLYSANAIAVVDLASGTQTGSIDLSPFLDPSDHDGSADPDSVFYDAAAHRAYFLLSRIDIYSGSLATSYTPACPPVAPLVIAIDTTTNAVVDLNGDGGGVGIELPLVGPGAWARDEATGTLFVVADGCAGVAAGDGGGFVRTHHGIASVNLTTRAASVVYAPASQDFLSSLLPLGDSTFGLSTSDENFTTTFRRFDPATPATLGAALPGVPNSAIVGGPGTLLGLEFGRSPEGGILQQVVRYDVATAKVGDVAAFQWGRSFSFATMAWVK